MTLQVFPIATPAGGKAPTFRDDFGDPRRGPPVHTHQGNDIWAPEGYEVVATNDGHVKRTAGGLGGNGQNLITTDGTRVYFAHLFDYVGPDDRDVVAGEVIGHVGATGNAAGGPPHLHFEVHPGGGAAVDPYPMLLAAPHIEGGALVASSSGVGAGTLALTALGALALGAIAFKGYQAMRPPARAYANPIERTILSSSEVAELPVGSIVWPWVDGRVDGSPLVVIPGGNLTQTALLPERAGGMEPGGDPVAAWGHAKYALVHMGRGRLTTQGTAQRTIEEWWKPAHNPIPPRTALLLGGAAAALATGAAVFLATRKSAASSSACPEQAPQDFLIRQNYLKDPALFAKAVRYRTERYGYFPGFGDPSWNAHPPSYYAVPTTFFGRPVTLNRRILPALRCVEAAIKQDCASTPYQPQALSGLRLTNTYHGSEVSNHVYGIAIDIDPQINPCCGCIAPWSNNPLCKKQVSSEYERMAMPECWVHAFERYGFYWLGHDPDLRDTMHFEFLGDPDLVPSS